MKDFMKSEPHILRKSIFELLRFVIKDDVPHEDALKASELWLEYKIALHEASFVAGKREGYGEGYSDGYRDGCNCSGDGIKHIRKQLKKILRDTK